jgi:hypothetical protein
MRNPHTHYRCRGTVDGGTRFGVLRGIQYVENTFILYYIPTHKRIDKKYIHYQAPTC